MTGSRLRSTGSRLGGSVVTRAAGERADQLAGRAFVRELARRGFPYLLLAPTLAYLLAFQIYPILYNLWLSLTDLHLLRSPVPRFIGLQGYGDLLARDPNFWPIFRNTFVWVAGSTVLQFAVGLAGAILLNSRVPLRAVWRGLMLVPWVTPVVVVGITWRWIYDAQFGLLNAYLRSAGVIDQPVVWLGNALTAWPALLLASTWKGYPYMCLMLLAGLQSIPKELHEAAAVDGAGGAQQLWHITLPLLRPVATTVALLATVLTWNNFQMIWVLTEGGPAFATSVLATYVYTKGFVFFDLGSGAATAVISTLFIIALAVVYQRSITRRWETEVA